MGQSKKLAKENSTVRSTTTSVVAGSSWRQKVRDLSALVKFRLSFTVVLSSVLAYLVALPGNIPGGWPLLVLFTGGFMTTAAANILNEVLEREYDKQMARTEDRPLAAGRMQMSDAIMYAGFLTLIGISLLALFNPWTAFLGTFSLVSYAFVYTPWKRYSSTAVFVGAVPGALPALIGCAAAEGYISGLGITLFTIQFFWQLPHFYAIGFLGYNDYKKAGFRIVPENNGNIDAARLGREALLASLLLLPLVFLPYWLGITSLYATLLGAILSAGFAYFAWLFRQKPERATALKMMFASFAYIPFLFLIFWLDQLV